MRGGGVNEGNFNEEYWRKGANLESNKLKLQKRATRVKMENYKA